ncbi:uncharacterized protein LOC115622351 [Scaptodrosophila lebanonensis]|uniref:Uncharacterized protein LOC115622351 n=1 Tax=Drosophila lebanonensis TaxID=7225 RepID=A0A6J2T9W3_DROLE|nr:uncharacterized protein LOC115622351 [Scaptodrosophila lebanonensis]
MCNDSIFRLTLTLLLTLLIPLSPAVDDNEWPTMGIELEAEHTALLQGNLLLQFAQQHKQIPRITYFTCRNPVNNENVGLRKLRSAFEAKNIKLIKRIYGGSNVIKSGTGLTFLRVVYLDVLRQRSTKRGRPMVGGGSGSRATFSPALNRADWLNNVLQLEAQRQIVAVDLACGILSRRFLEQASTKMLYNDKYHWLLIEDYALHMSGAHLTNSTPDGLEPIESYMEGLNLYINTELTLAKRVLDAASYTLYDVWNPGFTYGGRVNMTHIGYFTLPDGMQLHRWFRMKATVVRRLNMQHAKVRTMIVITNKNMSGSIMDYVSNPISPHIDTMNRFNFNMLMVVRDMFNWTFVLARTTSWGYLKNGRFDGMIGALIRNETDIGGSPIFYWLERHKFVDVAGRSWSSRPCFIFRHPRNTQNRRIVFLQPFTDDVWILIVVSGALTVFILWLLTTIEWKLLPHDGMALIKPKGGAPLSHYQAQELREERRVSALPVETNTVFSPRPITGGFLRRCYLRARNYFDARAARQKSPERVGLFLESVLFFVGIICQQGLGFSTQFISGRTIVITSLLFSFCIYQFYSASIVGSLLMERPKTIRTLPDLVQSSLKVGVEDILYTRDYFLKTKDPVSIELYAKKIIRMPAGNNNDPSGEQSEQSNVNINQSYRDIVHSHETGAHAKVAEGSNWLEPDIGLLKVRTERFAFHVDVAAAYKIIAETFSERDICDLTEISMIPPQKMVVNMQKNSPMRKVISYGWRRATESGILSYNIKVWHSRKPPCVRKISTSDLHVDMDTVSSALLILIFTYAIAVFILGLEILYKKWQSRLVIKLN